MSFRALLDRRVTVIPRVVSGVDARGNDVIIDGTPIEDVPAARDLAGASEETTSEDLLSGTYVYFFGPELDVSGFDVIVDQGDRFEVIGPPEVVTRRRGGRPHHVEAVAQRRGPQ